MGKRALPTGQSCGAIALSPMSSPELGQMPGPCHVVPELPLTSHFLPWGWQDQPPWLLQPLTARSSRRRSAPAPLPGGTQPFPGSGCASTPALPMPRAPWQSLRPWLSQGARSHPQHCPGWGVPASILQAALVVGNVLGAVPCPGLHRASAPWSCGRLCPCGCCKAGGSGAVGAFPAGSLPEAQVRGVAGQLGWTGCPHLPVRVCAHVPARRAHVCACAAHAPHVRVCGGVSIAHAVCPSTGRAGWAALCVCQQPAV